MTDQQPTLISFSQKRPALGFSDYLKSLGIPNHTQANEEGFAIILHNPEQTDRAMAEVKDFVDNPNDPKFWQASWQTGTTGEKQVYEETPSGAQSWWQRGGPVTKITAAICVLIYLAMWLGDEPVFHALNYPDGISLAALNNQWWRLLTPAFLHFSLLHIAFNLLWWWEFGGTIERSQSSGRLLGLLLVIALVSNGVQYLSYGSNFGGLSAVVYGVLGYVWIYPYVDPSAPFRVNKVIVMFMLGWLVLGYTELLRPVFGSISNDGHLSGLLVGIGLALILGLANRKPLREEEDW